MSTRVAVQQRQRLFREGLGQLLDAEHDIDLVGTAGTAVDIMAVCQEQRPDVVLLEADAGEWDAGRLARALRRAITGLRVIGLSTGEMSAAGIDVAHRSGIRDVLPRAAGIGQILATLRATPTLGRVHGRPLVRRPGSPGPAAGMLSPRELTVLNLVGAGFTSREISSRLAISHKTVENHKQRIFGKLDVQNQAHAVSVAMRAGLMRPDRVFRLAAAD